MQCTNSICYTRTALGDYMQAQNRWSDWKKNTGSYIVQHCTCKCQCVCRKRSVAAKVTLESTLHSINNVYNKHSTCLLGVNTTETYLPLPTFEMTWHTVIYWPVNLRDHFTLTSLVCTPVVREVTLTNYSLAITASTCISIFVSERIIEIFVHLYCTHNAE